MKNPSQDIYGTQRRQREPEVLSGVAPSQILSKPWLDAMRRRRHTTIVIGLIVFFFAVGVGVLLVRQYVYSGHHPTSRWLAKPKVEKGRAASSLDMNADLRTQTIMDELMETQPLPIPERGDMPLDARWIKQAAYHLVQAERSTRNQDYDEALQEFDNVLLIYPDIKGVQRQIGLIQLRMEDYRSAAATFEKVATEEEMTFALANNLGVAYLALEEYNDAERNFLTATQLNPQYSLAYFNLATLYLRKGALDQAAGYFDQYLQLRTDDIAAAQTYAMILVQLKKWDRAILLLQQISRVAPDVAPIHFRLAEALSHTANKEGALDALDRAVTLVDPRRALAWMSRPEFDELRNETRFQELLSELGAAD